MDHPTMTTEKTDAKKNKPKGEKKTLVTARHAVTQEIHRRGPCRASEVAADLGLKETTVSSIMYALYINGHAERVERGVYQLVSFPEGFTPTTGKLDIRKIRRPVGPTMPAQVISLLQAADDHTLTFEYIRNNTDFSRQATGAVLSNLVKRGILTRSKRGVYHLVHRPYTYDDRKDAVLRYIVERPWSRAPEVQRGCNVPVTAELARKILNEAVKDKVAKRDGFCYAPIGEKRSAQDCRKDRQALQSAAKPGPRSVGRPPKTRMALLGALRGYTRPRSVETLADRVGLSVGAVRSVLANMVAEGLIVTCKLRTDRDDMRLVYHYELARDAQGRETIKPPKGKKTTR